MREKIIKNNNNDKLYEEEFTQQSLSTNPFRKLKRNNSVLERELENLRRVEIICCIVFNGAVEWRFRLSSVNNTCGVIVWSTVPTVLLNAANL